MLDELTSAGEICWVGDGPIGENDGWVRWYVADQEPHPSPTSSRPPGAARSCSPPSAGAAPTSSTPCCRPGSGLSDRADYVAALWDLVWAGLVTGDTFAPVRARVSGGAHRQAASSGRPDPPRPGWRAAGWAARPGSPRIVLTDHRRPLVTGGPRRGPTPAARLAGDVFALLDRYGVVTRGSVLTENSEGGFGAAYRALSSLEESGQCRRGYFVDGLGAAQFALTGAVDRLRAQQREPEQPQALVLAACDPANPYGAALPWPEREGHRPGRKAGALVVLVDGGAGLLRRARRQDAAVLHRGSGPARPGRRCAGPRRPARSAGQADGRAGRRRPRLRRGAGQ